MLSNNKVPKYEFGNFIMVLENHIDNQNSIMLKSIKYIEEKSKFLEALTESSGWCKRAGGWKLKQGLE